MGAATVALSAFEIAVAGGRTTFTGFELVGIHGQTHRATRFAPFKTCRLKNGVQAFALGLFFDQTRTGHDHGQLHILGHFLSEALDHAGRFAHVFDAAVRA